MTQFTGLSEREAALSREKYGSNAIPESEPTTFWAEFKATFQDPMIRILLAVALLLWDKMHLTARYMKSKWRVSALEREVAKLKKSLDGETARGDFLRKVSQEKAQAIEAAPAKEKAEAKPEEVTAPDPDKA